MARKKPLVWSVSVYCRHDNSVLLAYQNVLGWAPIECPIRAQETPLAAARRLLQELGWARVVFPAIHKVTDAPPGLLLYEEHDDESGALHRTFAFVVDVPNRAILREPYSGSLWVRAISDLPMGCPTRVLTTMPYALTAGRKKVVVA